MKRIAIIPARAGSKRLPRKNVLSLAGKPLINWTVEAAIESNLFDKIVVSTDDSEVVRLVQEFDVYVHHRSAELASDVAKSSDVIEDVVSTLEKKGMYFEQGVLLQPTSPLRSAEDIVGALSIMDERQAASVVGFSESSIPLQFISELGSEDSLNDFYGKLKNLPHRTQDLSKSYYINGAIYVFMIAQFMKDKSIFLEPGFPYFMPQQRAVDIDTKFDFKMCELILNDQA